MPRPISTDQWRNSIAVIKTSLRADCGHPARTDIYRFRKDEQLGEIYTLCGHCAAAAETQGLTVYKYREGRDKRPFALKRVEL